MSAQEEIVRIAQSISESLRRSDVKVSYRIRREDSSFGPKWTLTIEKETKNAPPRFNNDNSVLTLEDFDDKKFLTLTFRESLKLSKPNHEDVLI